MSLTLRMKMKLLNIIMILIFILQCIVISVVSGTDLTCIKRKDIIPFALSQGGNYNRHNLYVEVSEAIKKNGYLHKGMKTLLKSLGGRKTRQARKLVESFFNEVSLCGPRIVDAPGQV